MLTDNVKTRGWVHGHFHYWVPPDKGVWWDNGRESEISCDIDYLQSVEWAMSPKECHFSGENFQDGHIVVKNFWRIETGNGYLNDWGYQVNCLPRYVDLYWNGHVSENNIWENNVPAVDLGEPCPWPQ
jgi:hypothetical protein